LGVIRQKPEIKYKSPESFSDLPALQFTILENSSKFLKVGGELVYSTCTINKAENENVVEEFLSKHPEFEGVEFLAEELKQLKDIKHRLIKPYYATIFPQDFNSNGFFIAKIRRISENKEVV
jgi:16S rRNA (cytosine967-C5)-methyltransferase